MRGYQGYRKLTTGEVLKLNINTFKFNRADNADITSTWKSGSNINIKKRGNSLIFEYTATTNGNKQNYNYSVEIDYTPCNYGGERKWFICPHCLKRVGCLHLRSGVFRCRSCQNLNYAIQQESKIDYAIDSIDRKIYKIQDRLKAERDINIYYIPKPKYMQYKTYEKLTSKLNELHHERNRVFCVMEMAFIGAMDKKLYN